jgi:hypothetical protein
MYAVARRMCMLRFTAKGYQEALFSWLDADRGVGARLDRAI